MKIAIATGGGAYRFLTNERLQEGDKVFPLAETYRSEGTVYFTGLRLTAADGWRDPASVLACTGWPSEPHTITRIYEDEGIEWVRTEKGYSPAVAYFKEIQ